MFDTILLLSRGGKVIFHGPGAEMIPYFHSLNHRLPPLTNPADFALDLSSIDLRDEDVETDSRARVEWLVSAWILKLEDWKDFETIRKVEEGIVRRYGLDNDFRDEERRRLEYGANYSSIDEPQKSALIDDLMVLEALSEENMDIFIKTVRKNTSQRLRHPMYIVIPILVARSFKNLWRQPALVIARLMQIVALGVIFALYFSPFQLDQPSVTSRIGFLQQCGAVTFVGMLNSLAVFPQELLLFKFEHQDGVYSTESFFWTYTINEIPFGKHFQLHR